MTEHAERSFLRSFSFVIIARQSSAQRQRDSPLVELVTGTKAPLPSSNKWQWLLLDENKLFFKEEKKRSVQCRRN